MNNPIPFMVQTICLMTFLANAGDEIRPGEVWPDNNGVHINAHGGGILEAEGLYWWYGEDKIAGKAGNNAHAGVHVYSSDDLLNWRDEGLALDVRGYESGDLSGVPAKVERPKVLRSLASGKYVMYFHLVRKGEDYYNSRVGIAVASNPRGPFRFVKSVRPNAGKWPLNAKAEDCSEAALKAWTPYADWVMPDWTEKTLSFIRNGNFVAAHFKKGQLAQDQTLFRDDDGKSYHIYASEFDATVHIAELRDDLMEYTGRYWRAFEGTWTEAPAVCKRNGWYYLLGSGCSGWEPNAARYYRARSLAGPWESMGNPCRGINPGNGLGPEKTWGCQSTFILPYPGRAGEFIALFDMWRPNNAIDGRYVWLPVEFDEEGKMSITWRDSWHPEPAVRARGKSGLTLVPRPRCVVERRGFAAGTNITDVTDTSLPSEGYRLDVSTNGVTVFSRDAAGAFYARQTLKQLGLPIPCVLIEDSPAFRWRGFMLDEGRHFFGKEVVKRCLDRMAEHKMNVFHWHLTEDQGWRIAIDRFPELVQYGSVRPDVVAHGSRGLPSQGDCAMTGMRYGPYFYTAADIAEILAYANERQITVVPEIELPGHIQALLAAHPEYSCKGDVPQVPRTHYDISEEVLCVGNDEAIAFMERVYDEIVKMFPGVYVHIGGDECPRVRWKACPKCQKRIKELGLKDEEELQGWVTRHFADYLAKKGRRAIGWDEVLSGDPVVQTIVQIWREPEFGKKAAAKGCDIIVSPWLSTYFTLPQGFVDDDPYTYLSPNRSLSLEKAYRFDPYDGLSEDAKPHVLGSECCIWSECVWNQYDLEWKLFPRLCAFSEALWTAPAEPRDIVDFERRMFVHRARLVAEGVNCAPLRWNRK